MEAVNAPFRWDGMTMYEWMQCDMQWLHEAQTVITAYRNGQQARREADAKQSELRAG